MKITNLFLVIAVLLLPGLVLAQNDFDQTLGQSSQTGGQGNEITTYDQERVTTDGQSQDEGQNPQDRVIRFGEDQPDQGGSQKYRPDPWETVPGLEEAAKAYFTAKNDFRQCKATGDTAGMRRAAARMTTLSRRLDQLKKEFDTFKLEQAAKDSSQDEQIKAVANSVGELNRQVNDPGGINDRLGSVEKEVSEYVTPAIAGIDGKFNAIFWWLLFLTIIVIIGFGRRYWLTTRSQENR